MRSSWPEYQLDVLRRLWAEGKTGQEISDALEGDRSRSAVVGMARRLNLPSRPSPLDPANRRRPRAAKAKPAPAPTSSPVGMRAFGRIEDLVADRGMTLREAAETVGVGLARARAHFDALRARYDFGLPATAVDDLVRPVRR